MPRLARATDRVRAGQISGELMAVSRISASFLSIWLSMVATLQAYLRCGGVNPLRRLIVLS
jgi:hypothetical protein